MFFYKNNIINVLVFTVFSTFSIFSQLINLDEIDKSMSSFNIEKIRNSKNLLGQGSFKTVYKTVWEGKPAVLIFYNSTKKNFDKSLLKDAFNNELKFYQNYQDKHIIKAFAYSKNDMFLVLEYAESDLLKKFKGSEANVSKEKIEYFLDVSKGIKFLHDNRIIHRDIKPSNVVLVKSVAEENRYIAKIVDFDNYIILPTKKYYIGLERSFGSTGYKAPEIILKGSDKLYHYSFPSDIYALGALFFNVLLKTRFFSKAVMALEKILKKKINKKRFDKDFKYKLMIYKNIFNNYETILDIIFKKYIEPKIKDSYDDSTKNFMLFNKKIFYLIKAMLAKDPKIRPNIGIVIDNIERFLDEADDIL